MRTPAFGVAPTTAADAAAEAHRLTPSYALPLALASLPILLALPPVAWLAVVGGATLGVGATFAQARREGRVAGLPRSVVAATD